MEKLKRFLKTTLLGGIIVILPGVLTYLFLSWLFNFATGIILPITRRLMEASKMQKIIADLIVIAVIIIICFIIGLIVKTRLGRFIFRTIEDKILEVAPGYNIFKETIKQFLGKERAPFSRVALVQVFENSALMTGFVTDEDTDSGYFTVYVPSGLNPTTGLIYHLKAQYVHIVDVPVDNTMRSIISCGGGSRELVKDYIKKLEKKK